MAKKSNRFIVENQGGTFSSLKVIIDTQTGVNYLWYSEGYSGSLTPLLNRDGSIVVTTTQKYQDE